MTLKQYLRIEAYALPVSVMIGTIGAGQLMLTDMGSAMSHWTFTHAFIMQTPCWVMWALLFPAVVELVKRLPLDKGSVRNNLVFHIGAGFGIVVLHDAAFIWFMHAIGHGYGMGHSFMVHLQDSFKNRIYIDVVIYLCLLGLCLAADFYRKYRERQLVTSQLEAQLARARLHALRMQLNPHFLFNALNSIAMLARGNENAAAVRMTAGLADLLRYVLEGAPTDEVTLEQEINFLKQYLDIEKIRFRDRVDVIIDVAEEAKPALIPNLLLQPLVENAVQHGVAKRVSRGSITIAARRLGDRLVVQITDDGTGLPGPSGRTGVGITNTRERLAQMYGSQQSLELRNGDSAGVVVTLTLPFHTEAPVVEGVVVA